MGSRKWDHWAPPSRLVTTAGQGQSQDSSSAGIHGKTKEGCQACTPAGLWVWKKRAVPGNRRAGSPVRAHPVREREGDSPGFPGSAVVENLQESQETQEIPGLGRSPGGGNGNPLQYSCLENPMDTGAWQAAVHGVAELDMTEYTHTGKYQEIMAWRALVVSASACQVPGHHS